jgi:hypothetical protein
VLLIATIVAACVLLVVLGFLVPRLSFGPQRELDRGLDAGRRTSGEAPGLLGRLLSKGFLRSRKAADGSASTGRRARGKLPF